jgi:tetratricopeptide (TPR) repeat protein
MKTKICIAIGLAIAAITFVFAQNNNRSAIELPEEIKQLEQLAEEGDTIALHKLLRFYDENVPIYWEVEDYVDASGSEDSIPEEEDPTPEEEDPAATIDPELEALYTARIEYWLDKGLAMNDPVAIYIKGMRLYDSLEESEALEYLTKSAANGYAKAALYCGSTYYNQGDFDNAIKYLMIAHNSGETSAGWHLAMCFVAEGKKGYRQKAIKYLRYSALHDYPEAVLEMKRIEPSNKIWAQKADSLKIEFSDFPIIPEE